MQAIQPGAVMTEIVANEIMVAVEAFQRFNDALKRALSVPRSSMPSSRFKKQQPNKQKTKS